MVELCPTNEILALSNHFVVYLASQVATVLTDVGLLRHLFTECKPAVTGKGL